VRLVDRYLWRTSGIGRDVRYEGAGGGHPEMCTQRVCIGPLLDKHHAQPILTIAVDGVQETPGLLPGAAHVSQAERNDLVDAARPSLDAADDDKHD
jgi:hypothetical protein